jgi:reactive chlorine resistance protein C
MNIVTADSADIDRALMGTSSMRRQSRLEAAGILVSRYGLVVVLLLIGVLKFTPEEAAGIQPLVAHSPLMSWMYALLSVQGGSNVIGAVEIATAALIALRPFSPKASFVGSLAAVVTFLLTVSFLLSTPGAAQWKYGFPLLGDAGQFLIKDLVLLGASFWTAAEAHRAAQRSGAWLVFFAATPIRLKGR